MSNWLKRAAAIGFFAHLALAADEKSAVELAERQWNACIVKRDVACAGAFLTNGYFLLVNIEGLPFIKASRELWLATLKVYELQSMSIDEMYTSVYGDVAVVAMRYSQKGHAPGDRDISGNFMLTDVWVKTPAGWKVAERHSSRAEKLPNR